MEDLDKSLKTSFVGAANQLTQLYTNSLSFQKEAFVHGYDKSTAETIEWVLKNSANNGNKNVSVDDLLLFLRSRRPSNSDHPADGRISHSHQHHQPFGTVPNSASESPFSSMFPMHGNGNGNNSNRESTNVNHNFSPAPSQPSNSFGFAFSPPPSGNFQQQQQHHIHQFQSGANPNVFAPNQAPPHPQHPQHQNQQQQTHTPDHKKRPFPAQAESPPNSNSMDLGDPFQKRAKVTT
eukprot:TRINITY_DN2862_c0_g1_i1.p1 TRINITY_DN2862_c0_g1~~TRINITY_DN2862_c0_g1_i1.p1  ORF type:complete len:236 (-),score=36.86 TRINITY_DN2862_c0_g1_i1:58-765(-)